MTNPWPRKFCKLFPHSGIFFLHPVFGMFFWRDILDYPPNYPQSVRRLVSFDAGYKVDVLVNYAEFPFFEEGTPIKIYKSFEEARLGCKEVIKYIEECVPGFADFIIPEKE